MPVAIAARPLMEAPPQFLRPKKNRRPGPGASLHGALAIAAAISPASVPPGFEAMATRDGAHLQALARWRASLRVFADEVVGQPVRFSSGALPWPPVACLWVRGGAEEGPLAVVPRGDERGALPVPPGPLAARVASAMWALTGRRDPRGDPAAAAAEALLGAMLRRAQAARAPRAPPSEPPRPLTGLSRWWADCADGCGRVGQVLARLAPALLLPPEEGGAAYAGARAPLPACCTLPHLDAFRARAALPARSPLAALRRACCDADARDARGDELAVGDVRVSHSERAVVAIGPGWQRRWEVGPEGAAAAVLAALLELDDAGALRLDPFLRRVAELPDPETHARAASLALALAQGPLGSRGARASDWRRASADLGVDFSAVWVAAVGREGWEAFCRGEPLDRARHNAQAMLRRSPLLDAGLLVYPAAGPRAERGVSWDSRPGERYELAAGCVRLLFTRVADGWQLRVRLDFRAQPPAPELSLALASLAPPRARAQLRDALAGLSAPNAAAEMAALRDALAPGADSAAGAHVLTRAPVSAVLHARLPCGGQRLVAMFVWEPLAE
jgi:hypothetical protein